MNATKAEVETAAAETTLEEAALAAATAKAQAASHKAAETLVNLFDETATNYRKARTICAALDKGATVELIASELSILRARKAYPEASEADIEVYASTKPNKGGLLIAASTIKAYVNAWGSLRRAGLTPTEATFNVAFRILSTGGTAKTRGELEKHIAAGLESGEFTQETGSEWYIKAGREILVGRKRDEAREGRPEGNNKKAPIVDLAEVADGIDAETVPVSFEGALHMLRSIASQDWSEEQRAELAAAFHEALTPVEVDA